jgi:hypothetical protein
MRQLLLLFLSTVLILFIGVFFGYSHLEVNHSIPPRIKELALPLKVDLDTDFIRKRSF